MALYWPTKRENKSARLNFVGATITVSKSRTPLTIEIMVYEDEKIIYLYIETWIRKQKLSKILLDSSVVIKLIG